MDISENTRSVQKSSRETEFKEFLKENLAIKFDRCDGYLEVSLLLKDGKEWKKISEDSYYLGET